MSHGSQLLSTRPKSVDHLDQADMLARVAQVQRGAISRAISREQVVQAPVAQVRVVRALTDPRALVAVAVAELVAAQASPVVVPVGNLVVVPVVSLQGNQVLGQVANQGEADLHARGKALQFMEKIPKLHRNPRGESALSAPQ